MLPVPARARVSALLVAVLTAGTLTAGTLTVGTLPAGTLTTASAQAAPTPSQAAAPSPTADPGAEPSPAPAARPEACARSSPESPVLVTVRQLLPRAPADPDEPFQVTGRLLNCGTQLLRGVQVRLAVGGHIGTRSGLRMAAEEPVLGRTLPAQDAAAPTLAPGGISDFDVRVLVSDLRLGRRNGVYPLALQVRARTGTDGPREPVGLASTFVPWFPEGPVSPTRLAWVTPLVDRPHRAPGEVMLDDELDELVEDDVGARGRLQAALVAGRVGARGACDEVAAAPAGATRPARPAPCRGDAVPMTWAIDPDLVYSLEAMARPNGYSVLVGGQRQPRPASEDAAQWIAGVRDAAQEGDVLALPYGDPDVVALSRTDSDVKDDVEQLRRLGQLELRRLLPGAPLPGLAWPPAGPVGPAVDPLAGDGETTLLLDASALRPQAATQNRTPNARTTLAALPADVTALVADPQLSALVAPDPGAADWQDARLAEQRWIAETAVIAAERPGQSRTLVVAPDRRADLVPALAAAVIADTGRLPWLCPVPLAAAAAGTERCTGSVVPDVQGPAPAEEREGLRQVDPDNPLLQPSYVRRLGQVRRESDQLTEQVLIASSQSAKDTKERLLRARGRAASSAWRTSPGLGARMLTLLADDVGDLRSKIVLRSSPAILTGRTGIVRVTVENGLGQPINVGVRLDPLTAARLTADDGDLQVVPGANARPVDVRVQARTSGRFTVRAVLVDAQGRAFGPDVEIEVRSTQYGRVALAVTGLGAAVLLVAAGARITRRALRREQA